MTTTGTITKRVTTLVAVAVLALTCCKKEGARTPSGAAPGGPPKPAVTSPAIAELLAAVPGNAMALGFIDIDITPWSLVTTGALIPLDEATRKSLDKELRDYVSKHLGLDLSKLQHAVGFVSGPPPRGAVLLKTVGGEPKMPGASDYEKGKLWVVDPDKGVSFAIKGDVVVIGKDDAVREVLETMAGKRKAVTEDNKPLVEWLRKDSTGAVFALAAIVPKGLPLPPPVAGLERVAVKIGASGVAAVVEGDGPTISAIQAAFDLGFSTVIGEVEQARQAAHAGTSPPFEGAMAIIGAAHVRSYMDMLKPRRDGNRLSVSIDLGLAGVSPGVTVAVIGVLAAVAIPAFLQYMKKSKAAEIQ